jgi:uncharacterized protein YjiS (DUF1127 family)
VSHESPLARPGHGPCSPHRAARRAAARRRPFVRYTLQQWGRRRRERAELARLDDRMLRDIGITRGDVWQEINKPFWRP